MHHLIEAIYQDCTPFAFILGGIRCNLTFSHGYVPQWCKGVYCRYYCDEGYRKNNDVRSVYCGRGGTWTSVGSLSVTADDLCRGMLSDWKTSAQFETQEKQASDVYKA